MNVYQIHWMDSINIHINDPCWEQSEPLRLIYGWAGSTQPETTAAMFWNQNGIVVRFHSCEHPVTVRYRNHNDPVNRDSCVELFLGLPGDDQYLNLELNAAGALHIQYGSRTQRNDITELDFSQFQIETQCCTDGWMAKIHVPTDLLHRYLGPISGTLVGNIYKCGDRTPSPHYLTWCPVHTPVPDFHRKEYFGTFILTERE